MRSLTKIFRTRATIFVALAYAFCVLAPSAALAFTNAPTAFHCLSELDAMNAPSPHDDASHAHINGAHHHDEDGTSNHPSGLGDKGHIGSCCGLFCMSALAQDFGMTLVAPALAALTLPVTVHDLAGCEPSRLLRPPIV